MDFGVIGAVLSTLIANAYDYDPAVFEKIKAERGSGISITTRCRNAFARFRKIIVFRLPTLTRLKGKTVSFGEREKWSTTA